MPASKQPTIGKAELDDVLAELTALPEQYPEAGDWVEAIGIDFDALGEHAVNAATTTATEAAEGDPGDVLAHLTAHWLAGFAMGFAVGSPNGTGLDSELAREKKEQIREARKQMDLAKEKIEELFSDVQDEDASK